MERLNFVGEGEETRGQEVTSRPRTVEIFGGKQRFGGTWNIMANIDIEGGGKIRSIFVAVYILE